MSPEQNVSPSPASTPAQPAVSAIENELPTYRAISPHAILAAVAGVLAIFSVVGPTFLVFAVLAVVLGFYAERKIQNYSDVLTGRGFAQVGIALGLIFGLGTVTIQVVQAQLRKAEAAKFTKEFVGALKKSSIDDALWYKQPPNARRDKSVAEVKEAVMKAMPHPGMFEMEFGGLKGLHDRANTPGEDVRFLRVEQTEVQDMNNVAATVIALRGPGTEKYPNKEEFALLYLKAAQDLKTGKNEWWVESIKYPYTPNTFVVPSKPVDDGHGHGGH